MVSRLGFAAFAMPESFEAAGALQILKDAKDARFGHVQFLVGPDKKPGYYEAIGARAKDHGLTVSGLYCMMANDPKLPCCPVLYSRSADDFAVRCLDNAALMGATLLAAPARGLSDPERGLLGRNDYNRLCDHWNCIGPEAKNRGITLLIEPVNRFEIRGPNTVDKTAQLLQQSGADKYCRILADTCHELMYHGNPETLLESWLRHRDLIDLIHLSAYSRGSLVGNVEVNYLAMRLRQLNFGVDMVIEAFTGHSPDGFFGPLAVHEPEDVPVMQMLVRSKQFLEEGA